ncbi:P-loop containing nucleoside triphosphate hydrolase protein [Naematelia encephala]|uniref:p-loop containing nucleoside triphosphate hydrolase protein n=1 Tax=Naematelia encephala TaxID=71784 RepID=A0A1Y2AIH1_9TREE|nr:P-loop containing nucleoside triphosphate hydrolase protein [Naematelia encephala]
MSICDLATLTPPPRNVSQVATILTDRWLQGQKYTRVGDITIAAGPTTKSSGSPQDGSHVSLKEPYLLDLAHKLWNRVRVDSVSQHVVAQGESGSGKTQNINALLACLIAEIPSRFCIDSFQKNASSLTRLLDSFGSASTPLSSQSSRFGKTIELLISTADEVLVSIKTHTFLLEQSRIFNATASKDESNYLALHQLASASELYPELHLEGKFSILPESSLDRDDLYDEWQATYRAMEMILGPVDAQASVSVLAGLLHLGNIDGHNSGHLVKSVATKLGLPHAQLQDYLFSKQFGGERFDKSPGEIVSAKNVLLSTLYGAFFQLLVGRSNSLMNSPDEDGRQATLSIALTDICGFESFPTNSVEQLVINLLNEEVHELYKDDMVHQCRSQLAMDGLTVPDIPDVLAIVTPSLEHSRKVLSILNDVSRNPKNSDEDLYKALNTHFDHPIIASDPNSIVIEHRMSKVSYNLAGMITKNRTSGAMHILDEMLQFAPSTLVEALYRKWRDPKSNTMINKPLGAKASDEIAELLRKLRKGSVWSLICIKPVIGQVTRQLASTCVAEMVGVLQVFWPIRIDIERFASQFCQGQSQAIETLLTHHLMPDEFIIGPHKVFLKNTALDVLLNNLSSTDQDIDEDGSSTATPPTTPLHSQPTNATSTRPTNPVSMQLYPSISSPVLDSFEMEFQPQHDEMDLTFDAGDAAMVDLQVELEEARELLALERRQNQELANQVSKMSYDHQLEVGQVAELGNMRQENFQLKLDQQQLIANIRSRVSKSENDERDLSLLRAENNRLERLNERQAQDILQALQTRDDLTTSVAEMTQFVTAISDTMRKQLASVCQLIGICTAPSTVPTPGSNITSVQSACNVIVTLAETFLNIPIAPGASRQEHRDQVARQLSRSFATMARSPVAGGYRTSLLALLVVQQLSTESTIRNLDAVEPIIRSYVESRFSILQTVERNPKLKADGLTRFLERTKDEVEGLGLRKSDVEWLMRKLFVELYAKVREKGLTDLSLDDVQSLEARMLTTD